MTLIELIAALLVLGGVIIGFITGLGRGHSVLTAIAGAFAGGVAALILYMLFMISIAACLWLYFKIKGENPFDEEGDPKLELDPEYKPEA